jgi:S-adenosylmethionine synthetase
MKDSEIAKLIEKLFDLRPGKIEIDYKLRQPIYQESAAYGHMGRNYEVKQKSFTRPNGRSVETKTMQVELFTWEKLDKVEAIKDAFGI